MVSEFEKGKLLLIDKPYKWTSFDVVNSIRNDLKRKASLPKVKIGHAGTLDPLATGLVIVCTGKWTKKIDIFQELEKEYVGQFYLGKTTPSFDNETEVDGNYPTEHITEDMIFEAAKSFIGNIQQFPPIYSAIKINGKRAYEYARQGEEVEIKPKTINISAFDITLIESDLVTFRIKCSKGTYIRSIARDFGLFLNSGAYLNNLRRTAIGEYLVVNAISPAEFSMSLDKD